PRRGLQGDPQGDALGETQEAPVGPRRRRAWPGHLELLHRRVGLASRARTSVRAIPYGADRLALDLDGCRAVAAWLDARDARPDARAAGRGVRPVGPPLPIPKEVTLAGAAARVVVPRDLNVNPSESVVDPATPAAEPAPRQGPGPERTIFALPDAIAFALRNSPRLRSARAAIERARGQEQVAFAPFLPQLDLLGQYGVVSDTLAPGIAGNVGFILANGSGTRSYAQTEVGLQWTLYDFGRTGGRYRQAVARGHIAELQLLRADQTVEFDVAIAYLEVLLARAFHRVQVDAVRRAEATLDDTVARSAGGVALREDVLRAQVQLSESREALVLAREGEFDTLARLNNVMGRNAAWPLEVIDLEVRPPLRGLLGDLLERSAAERPEV